MIAAVIYGRALNIKNPGEAWLEVLIAEVVAIAIVSALPKRIFLVRVRHLTYNFAMPVPLLGGYITAAIFGVPAGVGFLMAGVGAVIYWTADPRSVKHLARRLQREGLIPPNQGQ